jgi:hypothetical protein
MRVGIAQTESLPKLRSWEEALEASSRPENWQEKG